MVPRAGAAFTKPWTFEVLEQRGVKYTIRIPAINILERAKRAKRVTYNPNVVKVDEWISMVNHGHGVEHYTETLRSRGKSLWAVHLVILMARWRDESAGTLSRRGEIPPRCRASAR